MIENAEVYFKIAVQIMTSEGARARVIRLVVTRSRNIGNEGKGMHRTLTNHSKLTVVSTNQLRAFFGA